MSRYPCAWLRQMGHLLWLMGSMAIAQEALNQPRAEHPFALSDLGFGVNLLTEGLPGDPAEVTEQMSGLPVKGLIARGDQNWLLVVDHSGRLHAVLYEGTGLADYSQNHTQCFSGTIEVLSDYPETKVSSDPLLCHLKP